MFHDVNLSNLENDLQRNLRTDRASGGANFEIYPTALTTMTPLSIQYMYQSAQKNSQYVTKNSGKITKISGKWEIVQSLQKRQRQKSGAFFVDFKHACAYYFFCPYY